MARIPQITPDEKLGINPIKGVVAGAENFGGYEAQAMKEIGAGIGAVGDRLNAYTTEVRNRVSTNEAATSVAGFDYEKRLLDRQSAVQPGAEGFHKDTQSDYPTAVTDYINGQKFADPRAREAARQTLMSRQPGYVARAAQFEAQQTLGNAKTQSDNAIDTLYNKIRVSPNDYDTVLSDGAAVIDSSPSIPAALKDGMKVEFGQKLTKSRFDALLSVAKTPEEVDGIAKELADPEKPWQGRMTPQDFDRTLDSMRAVKSAIGTRSNALATAALSSLNERHTAGVLIDPAELQAMEPTIRASMNPAVQWDFEKLKMQQDVMRNAHTMPTAELNGRIAGGRGGGMVGYPGVPPELSRAADAGAAISGGKVSSSFLSGLAVQEYGKYLRPPNAAGNPAFAPTAQRADVDMRHVNPQVQDAAAVAGEIFGSPLVITSGHRSQERQDSIAAANPESAAAGRIASHSNHTEGSALDISTVGMDGPTKAKMVGALVQAGFTGFGEYGTHIHADMRGAVPGSYDSSKKWGGWTPLSPEVVQTLDASGYRAGADASTIQRGNRARTNTSWNVDYSKGADGGGSAVGVAQFQPGTWAEVMRNPAFAQDIAGKTPQQVLDLRKDPNISMKAAALYATQNKATLTQALGRDVNDGELYAAHFLGPGGAIALISAQKSNPQALAKDILPAAAEANKSRFYDGNRPLTVSEAYGGILASFNGAPSRVSFAKTQAYEGARNDRNKQVEKDMVSYAAKNGFTVGGLGSDAEFAERGRVAKAAADFYSVPLTEAKPFTEGEVEQLTKKLKEGSADEKVALMSQVQGMGGEMARAGMKQLGEKDPVFEWAAGLSHERGQQGTATDIMRGQERMTKNPDVAKSEAMKGLDDEFTKSFGRAMIDMSPAQAQAVRDAAKALYLERTAAINPNRMDAGAFKEAVNATLGGGKGQSVVDSVNGVQTILPPGLTGSDFDKALDRMTPDDLVAMSDDGHPPRFADGAAITPDEIASEAKFRAIGGNKYRLEMSDGKLAISDALPGGAFKPYVFNADPTQIKKLLARPNSNAGIASGALANPTEMQP